MPKTTTLLAGLTLVAALTYQSRINLVTNTANVQKAVDEQKEKNDRITNPETAPLVRLSLQRPTTSVENFVDNTKFYYKSRLIPSVKENWNAQVSQLTYRVIQSDLPTKITRYIGKNVFGIKNQ